MEQMSLFDNANTSLSQPLAARLRPESLEEFVGQQHLIGPGKVLRRLIESDQVASMIFWGPPGVGKTTLARIIARRTKAAFIDFSAVTSGIKEIRGVMQQADDNRRYGERTIVFVDEIHRFNKAQQDAFLPFVEKGSIILIGATTENPSFEVNPALLSRCKVFVLHALGVEDVVKLLRHALDDPRGFGGQAIDMPDDMLKRIAVFSNGDARTALSTLEMAVLNGELDADGGVRVRMLEAGEDPIYIARRVTRFASEDVGLADPRALDQAVAAFQACRLIGMPECSVHLTQAVVYMALAPKSNAMEVAYMTAKADAEKALADPVPLHLRNAVTGLMKDLDYGKGYRYAHDYAEKLTDMQCLPDALADKRYYMPTSQGEEAAFAQRLEAIRAWKKEGH